MRRTRRRRQILAGMILIVVLLLAPSRANATHDEGSFELDGNPAAGAAPGVDWNTMFPTGSWSGAIARSFVVDGALSPPDTSYFTGGGSKDPNNVPDWAWTPGDVAPDKDEISDAFAVAYRSDRDTGKTNVGDLIIAFGADRYAQNGDAQIGFWFFRGPVGRGAGGAFTGTHTVGDILVLSDFTQGGRVGTVKIYRWVGAGGSDGSLHLVGSGVDCSEAGSDDAACSEGNAAAIASPWSFTPKSGAPGTFPQGAFFEGAINVSRLVPGVRCFKSFMAETRSSQAVGAQLKDFALGPFDTCPAAPASPTFTATGTFAPGRPAAQLPATGTDLLTLFALGFDLAGIGGFMRLGARRLRRR